MYTDNTDEALIVRLKRNDPVALETLFNRHYKPLCHYCALFTKDFAAAEEIVADLFIKIWDNRHKSDILNVKSYLFLSVRNLSLNFIQKKKNPVDSIEDITIMQHELQDTNTPFSVLSGRESDQRILRMIERLPARQREVLLMSRIDAIDKHTIAQVLGISVRTVETTLYLAIQQLRNQLKIS